MRILLFLMIFLLVSCGGVLNSDNVPPRMVVEPLFVVVGNFPEGMSPKDIQVVAYQTKPVRKMAWYGIHFGFSYVFKNGESDLDDRRVSYRIEIDGHVPADEIVWYNKGVAYQTLKIEYVVKNMEIVSYRAYWNGERELCLNSFYGGIARRIHIHMPDTRMPEEEWFTVFKDNPKCYETE
jgi:hypothetical protein